VANGRRGRIGSGGCVRDCEVNWVNPSKQPNQIEKAQAMVTKAGVWIDHKQAIVVLLTDAGQEIKKIVFDIGQPTLPTASSSGRHKFTPKDFIAEDRLERKVENDRKDYFNDVIACIRGAGSLLILGPGEAKGEFNKHIKAKKVRGVVVELETADKLTDRQLVAKVQQHFATSSAKKPVAPKKTAKKATKATVGNRPKKSRTK
jgi:hypothetical protein